MGKSKSPAPMPAPQPSFQQVTPPPVQPIERTAANPEARDRAASNKSAELLGPAAEDQTNTATAKSSMLG
jgi:hypothetical protein